MNKMYINGNVTETTYRQKYLQSYLLFIFFFNSLVFPSYIPRAKVCYQFSRESKHKWNLTANPFSSFVAVVQSLSRVSMNCSRPGFPVLHYLPESAQTLAPFHSELWPTAFLFYSESQKKELKLYHF